MKKLFSSIFAVSILATTACNQTEDFGLFPATLEGQTEVSTYSKRTVRTDWFETLRPEVKSYYAQAQGKTGAALFDTLHEIISKNTASWDYQTSKSYMYATADNVSFNSKRGVFDAYSNAFIEGTGGDGNIYTEKADENNDGYPKDFINCEHTWPQSFFNKQTPMVSDLHHMFSTTSVPNAMRSNYPFGMATGVVPYTTNNGSKLSMTDKTGKQWSPEELRKILNLPYQEAKPLLEKFNIVFEPGDKQKGNTARAMLYFYLRYFDQNIRQGDFNKQNFWDSKVSTFIQWSEVTDPVDNNEIARDEFVFQKQHNRNPFIDIPNLASLIGESVLKAK